MQEYLNRDTIKDVVAVVGIGLFIAGIVLWPMILPAKLLLLGVVCTIVWFSI